MRFAFLFLLLLAPAALADNAPTQTAVEAEIEQTLDFYEKLGSKPFETFWKENQVKEKYTIDADGFPSYTKFFPAGNFAVRYQKKKSGVVVYEKNYGNGQEAVLVNRDERITDYTSYWPNGQKKAKYQHNRHTKEKFFNAWNEDGKPATP